MITTEEIREFALSLPHVTEETPFGPDNLVYKVGGRMFLLLSLDEPYPFFNVKCDPERAIDLRVRYEAVTPGYHMHKAHWNSIRGDKDLDKKGVIQEIKLSYDLVFDKLPKKVKAELQQNV
ncbi:MmcQ/YjbR family DNA-binding protein [Porphyromonas sp.]|uniref:MmcQ/YjbR family DNA-binding protein n=1 Tax=Porphyromonas sp. TaxID=1924944 RepID=UPI0026DDC779|nr:MmcQ/YjbR family DNA-binding protein [Porphyromonas sp.]MDO4695121.1 MmcQ/YjbR family DNA-binding protein [Porphyromonas sp.]MDO4770234.1 MmcQ/YjbR family DNA-binding protein [Porphyromonas sp.]